MGTGYKGGATHYHSIAENLPELTSKYKFQNGYFGERGTSSQIRVINCSDQYSESKAFYNKLAYGGIEEPLKKGNGVRTNMADGTIIIYREYTSTDGSPAVDIGIKFCSNKGLIKQQRVHFVKDKDNEEIQSSN
jgi:hypothetical protein